MHSKDSVFLTNSKFDNSTVERPTAQNVGGFAKNHFALKDNKLKVFHIFSVNQLLTDYVFQPVILKIVHFWKGWFLKQSKVTKKLKIETSENPFGSMSNGLLTSFC